MVKLEADIEFYCTAIDIELAEVIAAAQKPNAFGSSSTIEGSILALDGETNPVQIIRWEHGDPENPYNWSLVREFGSKEF